MAVAQGYGKTVTSGSVFAYDTGDTRNSYRGEPTTNICTGVAYSIYDSGATNYRNQTNPIPPVTGYEVVKVVANTPGTYGQSILWRAPYATNVMTITNSVYAWLESGTYVQVGQHWYPWNYGSPKYIPTGQWIRISETYAINEGSSYGSAAMVYSTDGVAYFCMPQYEIKPHITPFVGFDQTRSATQGLLPLIGNSTIDLTNVSFDSNAQMVFDGTNDYIDTNLTNLISGTNPFTIEAVTNKTSGDYGAIIGNYGPSYDNLWFATAGLYLGGACYHSSYSTTMAGWHYSAVTRNTLGNTILYRDGVQVNTATLTKSVDTGINWRIGADVNGAGEAITGNIPLVKVYNRVLSAAEVAQNYRHYKTRFNLS